MSTKTKQPKPVAWRHDNGPFARIAITHSQKVADHWVGLGWDVTPLYEAQPAPTIPNTVPKSVFDVIYEECEGFVECSADPQRIWDACRAAMLAAAPEGRSND